MKRFTVLLVLCLSAVTAMKAQEICNNGSDDDGDGFIDCYDKDCSVSTFCKDFFLGEDAKCQVTPPAFPKFTMSLDFASPDETTNHLSRMAIGDLNRDGRPEIITMNRYTNRLFILNGSDGSIQQQATVTWEPQWEIAIANIDDDSCGEIYFYGVDDPPGPNNSVFRIYAYDCNLNFLWQSDALPGEPVNYGLADFDGDGKVELYVKDEVYDAHTGTRIIKSTASNYQQINGGPVAVDMVGDDKLELVIGCFIYQVNLGARTLDGGSLTLLKSRNDYFIRNEFNATSVADYNHDGSLDVLASGSTTAHGKNTTVFFWDVKNDVLKTYSDPMPGNFTIFACPTQTGTYYQNGWKNGTGRLNIADLDGDGELNVSYVSGKFLYALDENLNPMSWSPKVVNEETSGYTGCTLFDFNGDGKSEIVYRDEKFLYIINGTDGTIYNQQTCVSRTNREYPIVADVDADGSTELCVTCGFDDANAVSNFCDITYSRYSHVRVFRSASDPWVPARRVWNQHGYFNVNVNDDLTIPRKQQKHHLVFSTGSCTQGPNRPLNNFLNQSPFLNIDGCPTYKSPDLAFVNNSLTVNPPTCPSQNFTISFKFQNVGDIALSGDIPITFYNGNPSLAGAIKLNTITIPVGSLGVNGIQDVTNATVSGPGGPFILYIVLNDNGSTVPTPISLPNTDFLECDYSNNILSSPVNPIPVAITALKVQDNIKCTGSASPDNGAVRAFIPMGGGVENTADYNFFWSKGAVAKPAPADYQGAAINGLPNGSYTVFAIHKTANCSSTTATVVVNRIDKTITVDIALVKPYSNCKIPNGELKAIVNDADHDGVGDPVGNFTFVWYEGNDIFTDPQVSVSHLASGLKPLTYTVVVTDKATGCQSIHSFTVPDQSVKPVATATTTPIICSPTNSGSASATVGGSTAGFKFEWYNGNIVRPSPDFTGANYNNIPAGNYTVVATNNASQCESDPVTVTVGQTTPIVVAITNVAPQTSCDASLPNGSASANVGGTTTGFTFQWFKGQNTLPANLVASTPTASGLAAGIYTVKATKTSTGCSDTDEVTINFSVVTPKLILAAVGALTNCTTPNGSVTVNVTLDTPTDYTFSWYNGTSVKATADYPNTTNVLSGLPIGSYTVQAVHKTKHCATAPISATVTDNTPAIDIQQNSSVKKLPTDCKSNDGLLEVVVSAPGNIKGFRLEWFKNQQAKRFAYDSGFVTRQDTLSSAVYTIKATNLDNGCVASKSFELPFATAQSLDFISQADATTCSPNNEGNFVVKLTPTPAVIPGPPPIAFSVSDYVINFYAGKGTQGTLIQSTPGASGVPNGDGTANYTLATLSPGTYTAVAVEASPFLGGCPSIPVFVDIKQNVTFPDIVATQIDVNMNCNASNANGKIQLDIDGAAAPESNYTYSWFEGTTTASPALGTATTGSTSGSGEIAQNLPAGMYTVQVKNIATQCPSVNTFQVLDNPPSITIASGDLVVTDITMCSHPNGASATINTIRENGTPGVLGNYTFAWFDSNLNILPNAGTPNTTNSIIDLPAGDYFLRATKIAGTSALSCASALIGFTIQDKTNGTIQVALTSFTKPTRCLQPTNITGQFTVNASGNSTTGYIYRWYAGNTATGPIVSATPTLSGITIPNGQNSITFTVEALNNTNQCVTQDTYVLPLDVVPVTITASAAPLTFCNTNNGAVFATVTSGGSTLYNYNWYNGNVAKPATDFSGKSNNSLTSGNYTVVAVDQADNFCQSSPVTVKVTDERISPIVSASMVAPLTICDPAKPDGVAKASVSGDVINYTFDWYNGNPPAGAPLFRGSQFGNLIASTFSVIATHLVSGCSDTTQVAVTQNKITIPLPNVELLSNVTSCVTNNGALSASVNGNTGDFIFHWYIADPGPAPDTSRASFKGEIYNNLNVGQYYVSATSRKTGCISGPANGTIIKNPVFPDFNFKIEPASCEENNGFLSIFLVNEVDIASVVWNANGNSIKGPNLEQIPAGVYAVTVTSTLGCSTTKDVEVKTEIHPYNGVSRTVDGKNDIFLINCIENFPDNLVKIFNRAGTLVFEAEGYDNVQTYFDGKSNKGIALMGNNLPDGTYFYIIDKRDGTKPVAGYLEVVN
jgi:hypothetical protein